MTFPRPVVGLAVLVLVAVGLSRWGSVRSDAKRNLASRSLHVELSSTPGLSVAARVGVVAPRATDVVVRHGRDRSYGTETPRIAVPRTGNLSTTIIGLTAGAMSHVEVVARYDDGTTRTSGDLTVTMPSLDVGVPGELPVAVRRGDSTGVVLLAMNGGAALGGVAVMVDRSGRVVWYRHCGREAFAFDRGPNGHLLLYQFDSHLFEELTLDGTVVRTWTDSGSLTGADGHDFRMLMGGSALIFGAETHQVDSRALFPGGVVHATRWDDTVSEIASSGAVLWRWSSWGHVSEAEITGDPDEPFTPSDYEVVHTNSIEPAPDGNLLLSFRNTSSVVKLDRASGNILWRLGGKRSDFRVEDDPLGGFSRQHDARLIGLDRVLLFDNGTLRNPPESRAVEYRLDEVSKTATMVWQYRRSPPLFARISGSVQRLPNGHTLISWGPRGTVTEVDESGTPTWEATTPGFGVYRARVVESAYP